MRASDTAFTPIDAVAAAVAGLGTTAVWGQVLAMIETGQLALDVLLAKQAARVSQLVAQHRRASLPIKILQRRPTCPLCSALAQRPERPVLDVQPVSGMQRHTGDRIRLIPREPSRTSHRNGRDPKGC